MTFGKLVVSVVVAGLGCVSGLLLRANQRLERQLVESRNLRESAADVAPALPCPRRLAAALSVSPPAPAQPRAADAGVPVQEPEPAPEASVDPGTAKTRIAATFARTADETPEQYRARVVPIVRDALAEPRAKLASRLQSIEQDAGVTEQQHAELEAVFRDAFQETLGFTDEAIQTGRLSPYELSWTGLLSFGGGLGAIAESAQDRIAQVLSPEQQETFASEGFDWAEYLSVQAPWEQLQQVPSPPPQDVVE